MNFSRAPAPPVVSLALNSAPTTFQPLPLLNSLQAPDCFLYAWTFFLTFWSLLPAYRWLRPTVYPAQQTTSSSQTQWLCWLQLCGISTPWQPACPTQGFDHHLCASGSSSCRWSCYSPRYRVTRGSSPAFPTTRYPFPLEHPAPKPTAPEQNHGECVPPSLSFWAVLSLSGFLRPQVTKFCCL